MNTWVIALVLIAPAILVAIHNIVIRVRRKRTKMEDLVEYPRIARVEMHPIRCKTCGEPIQHNDLVVWAEKTNGWRGESSHAKCVIIIRHLEGNVTTLEGKPLRTNENGGVIDPLPKGALLLTEAEWDNWHPPKIEVLRS